MCQGYNGEGGVSATTVELMMTELENSIIIVRQCPLILPVVDMEGKFINSEGAARTVRNFVIQL